MSGQRRAGRTMPKRTAKSCGPDASAVGVKSCGGAESPTGAQGNAAKTAGCEQGECWTEPTTSSTAVENWLAQFETALKASDDGLLKSLFHPDSYWRDTLALSWTLQTVNGRDAILRVLKAQAAPRRQARFCDRSRPPRAAQGDARRHRLHRGDLWVRDRDRPRRRHSPADPGCRRRQPAEGMDAADRAAGAEGF